MFHNFIIRSIRYEKPNSQPNIQPIFENIYIKNEDIYIKNFNILAKNRSIYIDSIQNR